MTEKRDFLKEFEELRVETDGIRNALVSKTGHFHNLLFDSGVLKEIMVELKAIRKENKEIKEENDKKIEALRSELLVEFRQKLEENEEKNKKNLSELKNEILEGMKKIQTVPEQPSETAQVIAIRQAVLGEWKMVEHENFEGFTKCYPNCSFEVFSENVKYELDDGKLEEWKGGFPLIERVNEFGEKELYVEDNHLKTIWSKDTLDRYIENGKQHAINNYRGEIWKRVYEKI